MPNRSGNSKSNSKNQQDWVKFDFVEIGLDEKAKADFLSKQKAEPTQLLDLLPDLISHGYKVSVGFSDDHNTYIASLTCKQPLDPNFNYVMTSRSSDMYEALALAVYKHHFCCDDGDWGADTRANKNTWG